MEKFYCDRCGEEIEGEPLRMLPKFTKNLSAYGEQKASIKLKVLADKDFCKECMEEIVEFALNKNACDECIREMEENAALLRATGAEERGSGSDDGPDPDEIDWNTAFKWIKFFNSAVRNECGEYSIPLAPIDPEIIYKYRKAVETYGVPKRCIVIPPAGERLEEEILIWAGADFAGSKDWTTSIKYMATTEEVAKAVRTIRADRQCQSAQSQEAFHADKHGIPR